MKYRELVILLPCHSLEDFPTHHEGEEADGLLACWTSLWHPAFLAAANSAPAWHRIDDPPTELEDRLILVPSVSMSELPTGFAQRAKNEGAVVIRKKHDRDEIIAEALEALDDAPTGIDPELIGDFLALGYCFLQIQLLTRQMRYCSNLDEIHFNSQVVAAAQAAVAGDEELAREKLTSCFDVLSEERDHFYSVDAFLVDITLVAETTIGDSLRQELSSSTPVNLLLTADVLRQIAENEPATLEAMRASVESGSANIVGGEISERALPLLSRESLLHGLRRGRSKTAEILGAAPHAYGRRRAGLTPTMPQILYGLGYRGAMHFTLDDGRFPEGGQVKTRWEGVGSATIDAIARVPLDATRPETWLSFSTKLGESMDMDHVATVALAHWPGQRSVWYDDLRRIAKYGGLLGKFTTVTDYFRDTDFSGQTDRFDAGQYSFPYLKQSVIRQQEDPVSTTVRYWRRRSSATVVENLNALATLITGDVGAESDLMDKIDESADDPNVEGLDERIEHDLSHAVQRLADAIPRADSPAGPGCLVLNPHSFVSRQSLSVADMAELPPVERPVYAAEKSGAGVDIVVDVPAMGFAWVGPAGKPAKRKKASPNLAEDGVLRNEFFEALVNPTTGTLQSVHGYETRGNRISQQLAYRLPGPRRQAGEAWSDPDDAANYSVMAADSVEVTHATSAMGEIRTRGRLLNLQGEELAGFEQTYRVWRGNRVLEFEIELDPREEPRADPWNSYFACRFAWANESSELSRTVNQSRQPVGSKRFEAPEYIDIADGKHNTTVLTGGLPFHRRQGFRMLDSLLIVRGERSRRFRLGIGVDLKNPAYSATQFMSPVVQLRGIAPPPAAGSSAWLFHVDARNVIGTHWEPMISDGKVSGFRTRLLETSGRGVKATLSCFRSVSSAQQVDFAGKSLGECAVEDGKVRVSLAAHDWIEIEATW